MPRPGRKPKGRRPLREIAADLGISSPTLYKRMRTNKGFENLVRADAPINEIVKYWANRDAKQPTADDPGTYDHVELMRRKTIAQVEKAEDEARLKRIEADEAARKVLAIDIVIGEYARAVGSCKNRFLAVPSIYRNHLAGYHKDRRECAELETILDGLLRDILQQFADDLKTPGKKEKG